MKRKSERIAQELKTPKNIAELDKSLPQFDIGTINYALKRLLLENKIIKYFIGNKPYAYYMQKLSK